MPNTDPATGAAKNKPPVRTLTGATNEPGPNPLHMVLAITGEPTPDQLPDIQSRIINLLTYMVDPSAPETELHGEFSKSEHNKGSIGSG